jgi:uncharacterized protein YndB with AHSA1/START domain
MEVTREVTLPAPREEVWAALTEAERLGEWFANEAELDLVPGGQGVFRWADGSERRAVVEEVEAERRFAFLWGDEGEPPSRVEIVLAEEPEGTRVIVTETAPTAEWSTALALRACLAPARA